MGLDMYLWKEKYIKSYDDKDGFAVAKDMSVVIKGKFENGNETEIEMSVEKPRFGIKIQMPFVYFRKCNAIHIYIVDTFADGVDNCQPISMTWDDMEQLVDICKQVLDDHSKAEKLLPTQKGFFFGSNEYDDYYFDCLQKMVDVFEKTEADNSDFIYQASW